MKINLTAQVEIFQKEKQYDMLNALCAIGVFDRQANFEEIEHAAKHLTDLEGCPLESSEPAELKHALNELSIDGFLIPPEKEDGQDEWDCHPLVRAHLCNYIFKMDLHKASRCHHKVAHYYLDKVSENWRKSILTSLKKLNNAEKNGYQDDIDKEMGTKVAEQAKRDEREERKSKWNAMNENDQKQQQALEDLSFLQRAVYHFILAGELRNAWHLYWEWMSIHKEYVFSRFFGKFQDDLTTLSYFFESPWSSIKETKEKNQKLSTVDIASLFDAAGFRLRSFSRLTEAHQASGGAFLEWHKAGHSSHGKKIEEKKAKALRESSYAAGNRAEYSMLQASLADALIYANLAVRLADESEDSKARFIHRVELAEILWHRGDIDQAIEQLEWVDDKNNIQFKEEDIKTDNNYIDPRLWAELYCLYRYRFGKVLVSRGDIEKSQEMANKATKDAIKTNWLLNIGLGDLLNGYIKLAEAKPNWIISPQGTLSSTKICKNLKEGKEHFKDAQKQFEKIRAGHHELKARLGVVLCEYGNREKSLSDTQEELSGDSGISKVAGERHLFQIDAEVMKAVVLKDASTMNSTPEKTITDQIARARILCMASGYLRHLPLLDSLTLKKE